jgi:hypothetical protein
LGKQGRVCWVEDNSHVVFGQHFHGEKEVWDGLLSWFKSQFFRRQSLGWSLCTLLCSHRKRSQWYEELTVWHAKTNYFCTIQMMSKKWWAYSQLCSSLFSPFLVSVSLDFLCMAHAFFPERLSNHCQDLHRNLSEICIKFEGFFVTSIAKIHIHDSKQEDIKNEHVHPAAWNVVPMLQATH